MQTAREASDRVAGSPAAAPELGPEARVGAALRAAREAKGLSRRAFAGRLFMSHSNLAEYENGHRLAPAYVVEAYERELRLAAGSLLGPWEQARVELHGEMRERRPRRVGPAAASSDVAPGPAGPPFPPAQLPPDIGDFTGRTARLRVVCELLASGREDAQPPTAVVVAAIAGKAGAGKTTLAVHAAHHLLDGFPDGQLFVDLRGAEAHPLGAAEVLGRFLRALGVEDASMPESVEELAQSYRSRLSGKRVLVVLDNAASEAQVRPLIPGSAGCAVLITSRVRLAGLEGAHFVNLDVLGPGEALELLGRLAGKGRVGAEPEAARTIVALCGWLPLAVRIAGARLATRPHWSLARLVDRLTAEQHRLDELRIGDLEVRASLALSYEGLDGELRRLFSLLGLLDAPDFASWVGAALLDMPAGRAERLVEALVDAQLVDVAGEDATGQVRYRLHDLTRVYARERAAATQAPAERRAALGRALGAWLALTDEAAARMPVGVPRHEHGTAARWDLDADLVDELLSQPRSWFDAEQACLAVGVEQATTLDLDEISWDLSASLSGGPFHLSNRLDDWRRTHEAALVATRRAGNVRGEAVVLCGLGLLYTKQARLDDADRSYRRALRAFRELGISHGAAVALYGLGRLRGEQGRPAEALPLLTEALRAFEDLDDRHAVSCTLEQLGIVLFKNGRFSEAIAHLRSALDVFRSVGDRRGEALVLCALGRVYLVRGAAGKARAHLQRALHLLDELQMPLRATLFRQVETPEGQEQLARTLVLRESPPCSLRCCCDVAGLRSG